MRRQCRAKPIALLIVVLLVMLSFFAAMLSAAHANHHCVENDCTVCAIIHTVQTLLRRITLVLASLLLLNVGAAACLAFINNSQHIGKACTLIALKVRMNP